MKKTLLILLVFGTMTVLTGDLHDSALAQDLLDNLNKLMEKNLGLNDELNDVAPSRQPVTVTYDVWLSPAEEDPPHAPYHDCLTLDYDGVSLTIVFEGCGDAGPAWVLTGNLNAFGGTTCGGAQLLGWFLNGTPYGWDGDVIGGVMARPPKTWGFEGVRNDDCQR